MANLEEILESFKEDFDAKPWQISVLSDAITYDYLKEDEIERAEETIVEFDTIEELINSTENSKVSYQLREIASLNDSL